MNPWALLVGGLIGIACSMRGYSLGRTMLIAVAVGFLWELWLWGGR